MIKIPKTDSDSAWLNKQIKEHLSSHTFTPQQEEAITLLILDISYGYRHTISRMEWGGRMGLIATPGAKKRFLEQLTLLTQYVNEDQDRETIMFRTAELMSLVVNQFAFYDAKKWAASEKKRKR